MNKSHNPAVDFLGLKTKSGSILRGMSVIIFSLGTATGIIYTNYIGYWKGTIYRTQTVDFNISANLLPEKISRQLVNKDIKELQKSLDSNYGLFGIIVTNCKSIKISCPDQKIIYASKAKIEKSHGYKRQLASNENYTSTWLKKLNNADFLEAKLSSELFIPLYNPPAVDQAWEFTTPRESQIVYRKQKKQGEVIGRIYLLRAEPPLFAEELHQWLQNPLSTSSKTLAYNAIALAALLTGIFVWLLSEILYHLKIETEKKLRISAENEAKILTEKIKAEEAVKIAERDRHIALESESIAIQDKQAAEEAALAAVLKSEQAILDKQAAEQIAHIATQKGEQALREKQAAEEAAWVATQKGEQAILDKQAAEEAARVATQKGEQAMRDKLAAEEAALAAVLRNEQALRDKQAAEQIAQQSEQAILDKQAAEEAALAAVLRSEQALRDKQAAEEAAWVATQKGEQAILDKQAAEKAARVAIREKAEAIGHAEYLYDSIQEQPRELANKDWDSRRENFDPYYHNRFEVIQSSQFPITLDIIKQHRTFFEWIDSETRTT